MTHQATLAKIRFLVCGIKAGMSTRIPGPGPHPTVPLPLLLQSSEFEDRRGSFRVTSQPIHGAIPLGYSNWDTVSCRLESDSQSYFILGQAVMPQTSHSGLYPQASLLSFGERPQGGTILVLYPLSLLHQ